MILIKVMTDASLLIIYIVMVRPYIHFSYSIFKEIKRIFKILKFNGIFVSFSSTFCYHSHIMKKFRVFAYKSGRLKRTINTTVFSITIEDDIRQFAQKTVIYCDTSFGSTPPARNFIKRPQHLP